VTSLPSNTAGPAKSSPSQGLLRHRTRTTQCLTPPLFFFAWGIAFTAGPAQSAPSGGAPLPHSHNALKATRQLNRFF
jgi:hypothetical protein